MAETVLGELQLDEETWWAIKRRAAQRLMEVEQEMQAAQRAIRQDSQNNANRERMRRAIEEYAKAEEEAGRVREADERRRGNVPLG